MNGERQRLRLVARLDELIDGLTLDINTINEVTRLHPDRPAIDPSRFIVLRDKYRRMKRFAMNGEPIPAALMTEAETIARKRESDS